MHETIIARKIIEEAQQHGKVMSINLEIGELAHVPPIELVECIKQLVDWEINHKEILSKVKCDCGFKGHPKVLERGHDHFLIECPECSEVPELLSGTDVKLVDIEVE